MATIEICIVSGHSPFIVWTDPFIEPIYSFIGLGNHTLYDIPAGTYDIYVQDDNHCERTLYGIIIPGTTTTTTTVQVVTTTTTTLELTTTTTTVTPTTTTTTIA